MDLTQLVYASRPFGFDEATLNAILFEARENNARDGITGALICRQDLYLQLLEGPEAVVEAAFARIARDDRHLEVRPLLRRSAAARLFGRWAMRDDAARSWMWTMQQVAQGAVERAAPEEALAVFERLAREEPAPVAPLRAVSS
jgi:hypothetical protein